MMEVGQKNKPRAHNGAGQPDELLITFIRQLIAEHPGASRRALSAKLCEAWGWKHSNGALRDMVCRRGDAAQKKGKRGGPTARTVEPPFFTL
jgi:hypothetical protein